MVAEELVWLEEGGGELYFSATPACRGLSGGTADPSPQPPLSVFPQDPIEGANPVLYLSLAKELDGVSGKYFSSSCVITSPPEAAQDPQMAQSLWNTSVKLTNLNKTD